MKRLLVFLFACFTVGAKPPPATWQVYYWGGNQYRPQTADNGFAFRTEGSHDAFAAFLTTTSDAALLGDLTGKTTSAQFTITTTGNPAFTFGGETAGWNTGPLPPSVRFFISINPDPYNEAFANSHEDQYWWSASYAVIAAGSASLFGSFSDLTLWSNSQGHTADDPAHTAAFQSVIANVQQIGLAFGGGSFYDVGVAILPSTGTATFQLTSLTVQ